MSEPVEINVRSALSKIIEELDRIRAQAEETGEAFKETGKGVGDELGKQTKRTETFFGNLRGLSRRVADQLRGDFKSLVSINALQDSLKLSGQFKDNITETVKLADTIRKLGTTFGIAGKDFSRFQADMTRGLGEIGLSSDVASRSLSGLSETNVRGTDNLLEYSKRSGMLASIGSEQGQEGKIAAGMARVIQARGKSPNDRAEVEALAESVRRVFLQTGGAPSATLANMERLFTNMPKDMRKEISSSGLTNLAAASAVGGPNATKFIEEYLGKSPIARMAFDAQGGKGVFNDEGIDIEKFKSFASSIMGRVGGDPRLAAQTLGLSDDAAEGFVRLAENLDRVKDAQERIAKTTGNLNEQYRQSMGLGEAFNASINRVKKVLATPLSAATQATTDLFSKASESDAGAGAIVAGGGLLAAVLAGGGLKGIGDAMRKGGGGIKGAAKGLAGTALKAEGAEQLLGEKTIPVFVVNASDIGGGLGGAGAAAAGGGALGMLGRAGLVGGAGLAGVGIGSVIAPYVNEFLAKYSTRKTEDSASGYEGDALDRAFFELGNAIGLESAVELKRNLEAMVPKLAPISPDAPAKPVPNASNKGGTQTQKVIVELNERQLKASKQPTRGASN